MTTPTREASEFYDEMWRDYGHLDAVSPAAFHRRRLVVRLAREHAAGAKNVLDVGCGPGQLLRDISAALPGAKIHGADVSEGSLADGRAKNPGFDLFAMDLTSPTFATDHAEHLGAFDLIICSEVLEHIPDDGLAAHRIAELLAPGGVVIVTVPGGSMSRFDVAIGHQRHYTRERINLLLRDAGLELVRTLAWGFPFHNIYRTAVRTVSRFVASEPSGSRANAGQGRKAGGIVSSTMGASYTLFGKALKPLYYLNVPVLGEQTIAVARRTSR
jgi:SAM-dependent methyltransferase